jgi:hypothetical protein
MKTGKRVVIGGRIGAWIVIGEFPDGLGRFGEFTEHSVLRIAHPVAKRKRNNRDQGVGIRD